MIKRLVMIIILLFFCSCGISVFAESQNIAEKDFDIEVVDCSDNLSVDELDHLIKGQGELVIPEGESQCLLSFGEAIDLQDIQVTFKENDSTEIEIINTDQRAVRKFDYLVCGGGGIQILQVLIFV